MAYNRSYGLVAALSEFAGRRLRTSEVVSALGVSTSAYYAQREDGRLLSADNLLRLADSLGLNPLDLLLHYELLAPRHVRDYALSRGWASPAEEPGKRYSLRSRADAPPL